jgi:simple sugar transport system ATP-binding protein
VVEASLRKVTKRFPGIVALDEVSLDFRGGEIHVLLGENGAGKSTLLALLAGMQQPDAGEILIDGKAVLIDSPRRSMDLGIGAVFQQLLLVPSLSVIENLMLGGPWWQPLKRAAALRRFGELATALAIRVDPDAPVNALSLGEQQQVEIMRALWREEKMLLLDEPTSMLTPHGVADLGRMLRRLAENGMALILITHKLLEAFEFGDRISVLRQGRLAGEIDPDRMRSSSEGARTAEVLRLMFGTEANADSLRDAPDLAAGDLAAGDLAAGDLAAGDLAALSRNLAASTGDLAALTPDLAASTGDLAALTGRRMHGARPFDRVGIPVLEVSALATQRLVGETALREVSFDLWPGEVLGIAGVDGNGQKHLAEVLAGQRAVAGGRISLAGRDVTRGRVPERRRAGIRYVTDDRLGEGTVGSFSVAINLLLKEIGSPPYWRRGLTDWSLVNASARDKIRDNDIRTPSERTPVGKLSGGNIQKVLLARELGADARVAILNKPTYGLDLQNQRLALERIDAAAARGVALIVISTDLEELLEISDRIGVMFQGRLAGIVDNAADAERKIGSLMTGAADAEHTTGAADAEQRPRW